MMFHLCVHGVDGETSVEISTPRLDVIRDFLRKEDHEGSKLELKINFVDEEVYAFIKENKNEETRTQE